MKKVTLLRDFVEDKRISMDRYADQLVGSLRSLPERPFDVAEYQPRLGSITRKIPQQANLRMRFARYADYPGQVKKLDSDIFHLVDHGYAHLMRSLDAGRAVVTVHDMIPLLAGRGLIPGISLRRNWLAEYSSGYLKRAAKIIADSENTKSDIIGHCGCDPHKIEVVYPGLDDSFAQIETLSVQEIRQLLGLPAESVKLVLITGGEYYKNHATSLKVALRLQATHDENIALVRLGSDSIQWRHALEESGYGRRVMALNGLSNRQLALLYNAVDCLLFPSWYEGFGWPVLEAMACGTPVVTSNRASLPEVVAGAYPTFEADDVEGMTSAIESLLFDSRYRHEQIKRGIHQAANFSWEKTAPKVARVYDSI